ncbi:MAG: response regulator [Leptospirales bacterium]|nr:response regulator [Leptospirales bacterium]
MKKILLVDDQPNFIKMVSLKLNQMGFAVVSAENGRQGVEVAIAENPDLIVMDIMMPEMDGFTACEKIKAHFGDKKCPVVFLSAKGQESDRKRATELGAADFISKPFSPKMLIGRIEELLKE